MTITTTPYDFVCYGCGHETAAVDTYACSDCGDPLSIRMMAKPPREFFETRPKSMWDYGQLLPIQDEGCRVSIEEGATPLIRSERLEKTLPVSELLLKNEATNPTGSFKDRQVSVGISRARERGHDTVAVMSSGNVACAAAAYAARAGMRAVLFMHSMAGKGKIAQAAAYGATVLQIDTPSSSVPFNLCREACGELGWYHLSTAGIYEPFNVEGAKTIAYELFQQTGGDMPDYILAPVGGGGLLGGIWRGLLDIQRLGYLEKMPKLVGVQAAGCAPLVQALEYNWSFRESLDHPWEYPSTIAGGIADDILFDGHTLLPAIRTTGGTAIAVTDEELLDGELRLAQTEGILAEPTCSVVIAALDKLKDRIAGQRVCCVITGAGVKELSAIQDNVAKPRTIEPKLEAVKDIVGG